MDWDVKVYLMETGMCPLLDTSGLLLLRRNVRDLLSSHHDTLVYVQVRVSNDRQPHRYWWKSVLSFRPPRGVPHAERRAMFEKACNLIGARFGRDYRVTLDASKGEAATWIRGI